MKVLLDLNRSGTRLIWDTALFSGLAVGMAIVVWMVTAPLHGWVNGILGDLYVRHELRVVGDAFQKGSNELHQYAGDLARSEDLLRLTERKDELALLAFLNEERERAGSRISLYTVTDEKGTVLSRARSSSRRGDMLFLTSAYGRAAATGRDFVSFETSAVDPSQMVVVAGHPISKDGQMVGYLFVGNYLDTEMLSKFKQRHGLERQQLAVYQQGRGLTLTTFSDAATRQLLAAHFNSGTDWVLGNRLRETVMIENWPYEVLNKPLPGLEGSVGGVLLFLPVVPWPGLVIVTLCTFFLYAIVMTYVHGRLHRRHSLWRHVAAPLGLLVISVLVLAWGGYVLRRSAVPVTKPVFEIYNSTMELSPSAGVWNRDYAYHVAVRVRTGGEVINSVAAELSFNPDVVLVDDVSLANSMCQPEYFLEREIDNNAGIVRLACVIPNPGFANPIGTLAELVVRPRKAGEFTMQFGKGTQVLAHDGLGTNVLRQTTGAGFSIVQGSDVAAPAPYSTTHPNPTQWYQSREVRFVWNALPDMVYSYAFDQNPDTAALSAPADFSEAEFEAPRDGIYYFHLQGVKGKTKTRVSHVRVKIDATPPTMPHIKASSHSIKRGEILRLEFSSSDLQSGLQSNYYLKIGDGMFLPAVSPLYMPFQGRGAHYLTIRAFDNAGNYSDGFVTVTVR